MIPSVEKCFEFMEKYQMLNNIRAHSIMVEKVASMIARELLDAGVDISLEKIAAGALMHDIGKTLCLNSVDDHAAKGKEICLQNHLEEIADVVEEHVRLKDFRPDEPIEEKEIIYYADKRVNDEEVVSLEERLEYLLGRYGKNRENLCRLIRDNFEHCRLVEKKLFAKMRFGPEELAGIMEKK